MLLIFFQAVLITLKVNARETATRDRNRKHLAFIANTFRRNFSRMPAGIRVRSHTMAEY